MENKDKRYHDAFLRFGRTDTQNFYTQPNLIREILSKMSFTSNDKILVWFNVEFALLLVKEFDFSPKDIYIYTNTKDKLVLEKKGFNILYQDEIDLDKLEINNNMKFDVALGNPPFSRNPKEPKKLWSIFVEKSFEVVKENGIVSLITPSSWISITNSVNGLLKNKISYVNVSTEISKSFNNIGGTQKFIFFVASNNNGNGNNHVCEFDDNVIREMNICEVPFAPVKSSSVHAYSIVKKLYDSGLPIHNWVRYDKLNENGGVILPMSKGVSYNVQYNEIDNLLISRYKLSGLNNEDLMAIAHNLNLKLYKFLRWVVRSGPALAGNFKSIPIPTTVLSDFEIYTLLNLTEDEIAHIESNVK